MKNPGKTIGNYAQDRELATQGWEPKLKPEAVAEEPEGFSSSGSRSRN